MALPKMAALHKVQEGKYWLVKIQIILWEQNVYLTSLMRKDSSQLNEICRYMSCCPVNLGILRSPPVILLAALPPDLQ